MSIFLGALSSLKRDNNVSVPRHQRVQTASKIIALMLAVIYLASNAQLILRAVICSVPVRKIWE